MHVGKFRNRMPQRIIDLPERAISAVNVADNFPGYVCSRCSREGFDAIADNEHNVGTEAIELLREQRNRAAGAARRFHRRAPADTPRHHRVDLVLDRIDTAPMPAIQMHTGNDNLKLELGMAPDRRQRRFHQAEFGARTGDETDAPFTRHR
jgi:hypothetical protein